MGPNGSGKSTLANTLLGNPDYEVTRGRILFRGVDVDALKVVARGVQEVRTDRPELGVLLITHYQRILRYLEPDAVHVLVDGRVVESGGPELAQRLEKEGFESWRST